MAMLNYQRVPCMHIHGPRKETKLDRNEDATSPLAMEPPLVPSGDTSMGGLWWFGYGVAKCQVMICSSGSGRVWVPMSRNAYVCSSFFLVKGRLKLT